MVSDFLPQPDYLLSLTDKQKRGSQEQFLKFNLEPDTKVMLPIAQLTEVLKLPMGKIVPIPHMPAWVMGVYNWRGEILWMLDLGHLVGLTPWHQQIKNFSYYNALVLSGSQKLADSRGIQRQHVGLIVNQIEDIEWCDPDLIQSPPGAVITPELAPFLHGYWVKSDGEIFLTLSGDAIIAGMPKS
ncbi:MAG: chemotaxis protein CheW [Xenococcaceae cyanobacterium]